MAQQNIINIEELGFYANNPRLWAENPGPPAPPKNILWWQLKTYVIDLITEEMKWGPLSRSQKYQVLDQLLVRHDLNATYDQLIINYNLQDSVPVRHLVEYGELIFENLPEGKLLANVPGTVEIGRALIRFTNDIVVLNEGKVTAIDIMPIDLDLPWYSETVGKLKYLLTKSYAGDNFQYHYYSPAPGINIKKLNYDPIISSTQELYIWTQFWHSGIVNRISP